MGGSMSVRESGLLDAINAGNYEFYDRDQAATPEERQEIALKAFTCAWLSAYFVIEIQRLYLKIYNFANIMPLSTPDVFSII